MAPGHSYSVTNQRCLGEGQGAGSSRDSPAVMGDVAAALRPRCPLWLLWEVFSPGQDNARLSVLTKPRWL